MPKFRPALQLDVDDDVTEVAGGGLPGGGLVKESSFRVTDNTFRRDGLELDEHGLRRTGGGRMAGGSDGSSRSGGGGGGGGGYGLRSSDLIPVRALGSGNGGVVTLCRHKDTGTLFAVKKSCGVLYNRSHRDQMCKEIAMMRKLDCECLVQLHEAFYKDEDLEMVLEFMDLGSLDDVVKGLRRKQNATGLGVEKGGGPASAAAARVAAVGALPERALAGIAYQILWGLAYLKFEKKMHRDVKPQNILMNSQGQVKLADFGIAKDKQQSDDMSVDMAMTFAGTFKYMSPERIRNEKYSARCDLWSFGLVMVELATGRPAYPHCSTHIDLIEAVVSQPAPSLDPAEGFSEGIADIVEHCLKKDPQDRLPAEVLVGCPWFAENGISSVADAVVAVRGWLATAKPVLRNTAESKSVRGFGGEGGEADEKEEAPGDKEDDYGEDSFEVEDEAEETEEAKAAEQRDSIREHLQSTRDSPREPPQFKS